MAYFLTPFAEHNAAAIANHLQGRFQIAAQRDGSVMVIKDESINLVKLDHNGHLIWLDTAKVTHTNNTMIIV